MEESFSPGSSSEESSYDEADGGAIAGDVTTLGLEAWVHSNVIGNENISSSNNAPADHHSVDNNEPLIPVPVLLIDLDQPEIHAESESFQSLSEIGNSFKPSCSWSRCSRACGNAECIIQRHFLARLVEVLKPNSLERKHYMTDFKCQTLLWNVNDHSAKCEMPHCSVPFCRHFTEHGCLQRWREDPPSTDLHTSLMMDEFNRALCDKQVAIPAPDCEFVTLQDDLMFNSASTPVLNVDYLISCYLTRNLIYTTSVMAMFTIPFRFPYFVMRKVYKYSQKIGSEMIRVLEALKGCDCPGVASHLFAAHSNKFMHVAAEFCAGECLEDLLQSPLVMTESIIDVLLQVIDIIEHLQVKHNITLIDCRAKNFIVVSNGDRRQVVLTHLIPYAVLGDTTLAGEDIDDLVCSTVEVAAPEMLREEESYIDHRLTSMWSFGCLFYEMLMGHLPHPLPRAQGGDMPHAQGGDMPHAQGGNMPHAQGGDMPHAQGGNMSHAQGGDMPHASASDVLSPAQARNKFFHQSVEAALKQRKEQPAYDLRELPEDVFGDVCRQCLQVDPEKRPSWDSIRQLLRAASREAF